MKHVVVGVASPGQMSLPVRGRGLKPIIDGDHSHRGGRSPCGGAD